MIKVQESICEKTIHQVEKILQSKDIPIKLFSKLIEASKSLDFNAISDPIIKNRYNTSYEKIKSYFNTVIRMSVYNNENNDMYNQFMNILITLFAIFDTVVQGRLYISDIARQDTTIVAEFLENYGFTIHRLFSSDINKDFAKTIYGNVRKKGTTQLLTILLNNLGYNSFEIDEYKLNMHNGKFALVPYTTYKTEDIGDSEVNDNIVYIEDLDDVLWQLDDAALTKIFNESLKVIDRNIE